MPFPDAPSPAHHDDGGGAHEEVGSGGRDDQDTTETPTQFQAEQDNGHSPEALLLRNAKAAMARARGVVDQLQALKVGAASFAIAVRHGFVERGDVVHELCEQASNVGLIDAVGAPVVEAAIAKAIADALDNSPNPRPADSKATATKPRFKLIPFADLKPTTDPFYLVKRLIPRRGIILNWGPPKCGKSFWTSDLLLHVALGWEYRGRKVSAGPVVYCAFEGGDGFGARAEAFRRLRLTDHPNVVPDFHLISARLDLVANHAELIAAIRAQLPPDCAPVAVALDTLNRSIRGSESDDKDMNLYIDAADAIQRAFDCAVIIVHHCGLDGTRPRGHTSLSGVVVAQLAVKRDAAGNIVVLVEYMRDGPEGDTVTSRLKTVEVGTDADGDPITSCAVIPFEGAAAPPVTGRKLSTRQQRALTCLMDCLASQGERPPEDMKLPAGILTVEVEFWREEMLRAGAINPEAKNPRDAFFRVKEQLIRYRLIGERDGLVWSVAQPSGGQGLML